MGRPLTRERKNRFYDFIQQDNAMELILARLVSGGSLVHVCREFDIHYQSVQKWIEKNSERKQALEAAILAREIHAKERVWRELFDRLDVNVLEAFRPNGSFKPLHDVYDDAGNLVERGIPENVARFIESIEFDSETGVIRKIKFESRAEARTVLGKAAKMFVERHEIEAGKSWAAIVERSLASEAQA